MIYGLPRWRNLVYLPRTVGAAVVELAYTYVSGTYGSNPVRVQVPPAAPLVRGTHVSGTCGSNPVEVRVLSCTPITLIVY